MTHMHTPVAYTHMHAPMHNETHTQAVALCSFDTSNVNTWKCTRPCMAQHMRAVKHAYKTTAWLLMACDYHLEYSLPHYDETRGRFIGKTG